MKDQFEQHIKRSLENFEADYNSAHWEDMQGKLNQVGSGTSSSSIGKKLLIAASVLATAGAIYYLSSHHSPVIQDEKTAAPPTTQEPVASTDIKQNESGELSENSQPSVQGQSASPAPQSSVDKTAGQNQGAENKPALSEKTEPKQDNNTIENKPAVQEQQPVINRQPVGAVSPNAAFHADAVTACEGSPVQFTPVSENADVSGKYKWIFGDGETSSEQNPKHIFSDAGTYTVKLRVTSGSGKSDEQKNTLIVRPAPSIILNYTASEDNKLTINFEADADKVTEWKWNFGDKQSSSQQNPEHTFARKGIYKVAVTAKNTYGCATTLSKDVDADNSINLMAPLGFTPNGDNLNDTWIPVALLNGDFIFTITIFDKNGKVVFVISDKNRPWDGANTKIGETYSWQAVVKDKTGSVSNYKGVITIAE